MTWLPPLVQFVWLLILSKTEAAQLAEAAASAILGSEFSRLDRREDATGLLQVWHIEHLAIQGNRADPR